MSIEVTSEQIETTIETIGLIARLRDIPQEIFDKFQFAFGGTSLEVVPIHIEESGELSVFLIQRSDSDTYWPNEFHVPGTMVFPWDVFKPFFKNGFSKAWARLKKKEFMREIDDNLLSGAGTIHLGTKRGAETAVVHIAVVDKDIPGGQFFKIDNLPKELIDHHLPIIRHGVLTLIGALKSGLLNVESVESERTEKMLEQAYNLIRINDD